MTVLDRGSTTRGVALALAATALTACAGLDAPAPSESATSAGSAPTASPTSQKFTSPLYEYSIELPDGWISRPATSPWNGGRDASSQQDWLGSARGRYITAMAMPVPPETDIDAWSAEMKAYADEYTTRLGICEPIDDSGELRVAGEEARWFASPACQNGTLYVVWLFTVHDGHGYYFAWHSDVNDPVGGQREFEAMLATLEFARSHD